MLLMMLVAGLFVAFIALQAGGKRRKRSLGKDSEFEESKESTFSEVCNNYIIMAE
jgi:hypothetical protein